jgi:bZIP transcription factor
LSGDAISPRFTGPLSPSTFSPRPANPPSALLLAYVYRKRHSIRSSSYGVSRNISYRDILPHDRTTISARPVTTFDHQRPQTLAVLTPSESPLLTAEALSSRSTVATMSASRRDILDEMAEIASNLSPRPRPDVPAPSHDASVKLAPAPLVPSPRGIQDLVYDVPPDAAAAAAVPELVNPVFPVSNHVAPLYGEHGNVHGSADVKTTPFSPGALVVPEPRFTEHAITPWDPFQSAPALTQSSMPLQSPHSGSNTPASIAASDFVMGQMSRDIADREMSSYAGNNYDYEHDQDCPPHNPVSGASFMSGDGTVGTDVGAGASTADSRDNGSGSTGSSSGKNTGKPNLPPTAKSILERRERAIREGRRHEAKLTQEERRILRRLRNRESAERCARRKSEESDALSDRILLLERENTRLRQVSVHYQAHIARLEARLGPSGQPA